MTNKVYVGVSVSRYGGVTVLIDDNIAFCSFIRNDLKDIQKIAGQILDVVTMVKKLVKDDKFFACVHGDLSLQKEVGNWQGILASSGATIIEDYPSWFDVMVKPHTKDQSLSKTAQSVTLAQALMPQYAEQLSFVGFSDSYHIARFAKLVGQGIVKTENNLKRKSVHKKLS